MEKKDFLLKPKIVTVDLNKLKLDLRNVRFIHLSNPLTEKKMEEEIWKERDTGPLCDQIISAKGLYERPVVDSNFVVLEGNRRIVCLRHLKELANTGKLPGFAKTSFDKVECEQVPPDATQGQIDLFLAVEHVKGKKEWPTFNRAKMIYNLNHFHGRSYDFLAKKIFGMGAEAQDNQFVDLVTCLKWGNFIFELKTCSVNDILARVREAVAQLLEYKYRSRAVLSNPALVLLLGIYPPPEYDWIKDYLSELDIVLCWMEENQICSHAINKKLLNKLVDKYV